MNITEDKMLEYLSKALVVVAVLVIGYVISRLIKGNIIFYRCGNGTWYNRCKCCFTYYGTRCCSPYGRSCIAGFAEKCCQRTCDFD